MKSTEVEITYGKRFGSVNEQLLPLTTMKIDTKIGLPKLIGWKNNPAAEEREWQRQTKDHSKNIFSSAASRRKNVQLNIRPNFLKFVRVCKSFDSDI